MAIQFKGKTLKKGDTLYRVRRGVHFIDEIEMLSVGAKRCSFEIQNTGYRKPTDIRTDELGEYFFWTKEEAEQFLKEQAALRKMSFFCDIGGALNEVLTLMEEMAPAEEQQEWVLREIAESFQELVDGFKRAKKKGNKNDADA